MKAKVSALESVTLGTPNLAAAAQFYEQVWGLVPVAEDNGSICLRGTGAYHHIVELTHSPQPEIQRITFSAESTAQVDGLYGELRNSNPTAIQPPAEASHPGRGYGFCFKDPAGRNLEVIAGRARHDDVRDIQGKPRKLTHVVLNSDDEGASSAFFTDKLGFRLTDFTKGLDFLRCNSAHHAIGMARTGGATLNHIAFEMPEWDSVMRGTGRMKAAGYNLEWGIGRHGPGDNIFAYFVGPDDVAIEYTADVEEISDDHEVRGSDHWAWLSERHEQWGLAGPPSVRLKKAFKHLPFSAALPEQN